MNSDTQTTTDKPDSAPKTHTTGDQPDTRIPDEQAGGEYVTALRFQAALEIARERYNGLVLSSNAQGREIAALRAMVLSQKSVIDCILSKESTDTDLVKAIEVHGRTSMLAALVASGKASPAQEYELSSLWAEPVKGVG